ncbi:leader peptidase (prepilin peptidase)/N-methyltransferase [Arthrobacter pascens]|uniref:prepilin peptidase n=1 Tax=Arthrobacter pascens TaxID=1677 RepID=UPI00278A1089|nr:prepilin peptidase [Arthrobacter pascens]MDQ0633067.1 leader peptidase (prepilin peptidase)/N-methyltransferase [Arthrobacter pascens]
MTFLGNAGSAGTLLVACLGLLGFILSPFAEWAIAKLLPRLGGLPSTVSRVTTAIITGFICGAFAIRFGSDPALSAFILLAVLGVQLARIDISLHLLPNPLVLSLLLAGLVLFLLPVFAGAHWTELLRAVAGAAMLFVSYLILAIITPGGIGMGDVKLAGPVGLYLGYLGWDQLLYGGLLGFIVGGIASALVLRFHLKERPAEVAYGPSMLAAVVAVSVIWG